MKKLSWFGLALTLSWLTACGGSSGSDSGYGGSTDAAVISSENEQQIAVASTVGAKKAVANDEAQSDFSGAGGVYSNQQSLNAANDLVSSTYKLFTLPTAVDASEICTGGGTASYTGNQTKSTITYNSCVIDGSTASGTAVVTNSSDGSFKIEYKNFTITTEGITQTLNATISCDASFNCSIFSDFEENGRSYRIENSSVSGSSSTGYNVEARVYDEEYGYVEISSTGLVFDCSNGNPSTGTIEVTDGEGNTASIEFVSCTEFTVTVDGSASSYIW